MLDRSLFDTTATTLVNVLTCPTDEQEALLALLRENVDGVVRTLDGWRATWLVASADGTRVVIVSQWRDASAVAAMRQDERMRACFARITALATFDSAGGVVVHAAVSARADA